MFKYITKVKKTISTAELAKGIDESGNFLKFVDKIFNYAYSDKPNYQQLIGYLEKCLLSINEVNNNEFDWNK